MPGIGSGATVQPMSLLIVHSDRLAALKKRESICQKLKPSLSWLIRSFNPIDGCFLEGRDFDGGWPAQARFWLEWGCSDLLNSVTPTGANHRESDVCGAEDLVFNVCIGGGEIESDAPHENAEQRQEDSVQL